ncbi:MAG: alpha/beta fold hydrolase [Chlamydiia bacterium]|nr:alpha/beta fold hydrolase [Chlamydiia bacterium]
MASPVAPLGWWPSVYLATAGTVSAFIAAISRHPILVSCALMIAIGSTTLLAIKVLNQIAKYLPKPLGRLIYWIHSLAFESLAVFVVTLMHPLRYCKFPRYGAASVPGKPLILIHGYLHDSSAWLYLKAKLLAAGFGPVYCAHLGHPFRSIQSYAETVQELAARIEQETGRSDVAIIGHSMGGLVATFYATRFAPAGKVTDVITIGSPLAGTYTAHMAIGPNGREMEPGSELVQQIQKEILSHDKIRFYHIASRSDALIIPQSSALVGNRAERQFVMEDVGHVSLLFSPRVAQKITDWLSRPLA